jgi:hypothetical protein
MIAMGGKTKQAILGKDENSITALIKAVLVNFSMG